MGTVNKPETRTATTNGVAGELSEWRGHTRVFLQSIAAPSILGLYGFAVATFMVTAYLVGWYGTATSPLLIFPFATAAGGVAQGAAAAITLASAMMLASTLGRVIFPLGKHRREANVPGGQHVYPIQFALGEPGVKQGQ